MGLSWNIFFVCAAITILAIIWSRLNVHTTNVYLQIRQRFKLSNLRMNVEDQVLKIVC